ncbi:hypothetical protein T484DRAFT_1975134 [Baffinella frigidus]|nr:hypothetical protein T484DRAFT_1975134 [Cryptophyta sp. CCMP2293]
MAPWLARRVQDVADGDALWAGRSRRVLLCVVLLSSLAHAMPSGRSLQLRSSPQLPPRGGGGQGASAQVSQLDAKWNQRLEELRLFAESNEGDVPIGQELMTWCQLQRTLEKRGKLRADRKARLLEIRFVFKYFEDSWEQSFGELRLFAKANGGVAHVPQGDPERVELGGWCTNQRTQEKRGSLRADRKERTLEKRGTLRENRKDRLLKIGFVFDFHEEAWEQSFEELLLLAKANGGAAHVPRGDSERRALGSWCGTQKGLEKKGELRADRQDRLREIGFVFDPFETAWGQSLEELRLFAKANGGVAHASRSDPERAELGHWCTYQRHLEKNRKLRPDRKKRLLEIGFVFDEDTWDQSFEELRLFAEGNGGVAHVPQRDSGRLELGIWCRVQMASEKIGDLRPDRKARLLGIGFDFNPHEAAREHSSEKRRLDAEADDGGGVADAPTTEQDLPSSHVSTHDPERPALRLVSEGDDGGGVAHVPTTREQDLPSSARAGTVGAAGRLEREQDRPGARGKRARTCTPFTAEPSHSQT